MDPRPTLEGPFRGSHPGEGPGGSVLAADSVEAAEPLLPPVELVERRVLREPAVEEKPLLGRQVSAVLRQQPPDWQRALVTGDFPSVAVDGWEEQPQDVQFVGDEPRPGEEASGEISEGLAEVHDDVLDVVPAGDVRQGRFQFGARPALDELSESSTLEVGVASPVVPAEDVGPPEVAMLLQGRDDAVREGHLPGLPVLRRPLEIPPRRSTHPEPPGRQVQVCPSAARGARRGAGPSAPW